MAGRAAPSLQRKIATLVGVGAAVVTLLAGVVVVTSIWAADQGRIFDSAELLLLDQIELVDVVNGDVVLAPAGDGAFAIAIDGDTVVAVSGDAFDDVVAGTIIDDAAAYPDPTGEFISVAEIEIDGSPWATAYTSYRCGDPGPVVVELRGRKISVDTARCGGRSCGGIGERCVARDPVPSSRRGDAP